MNFTDFFRTEIARKEDSDRQKGRRRTWDEWVCLRLGVPGAWLFLKTSMSAPQVLLLMLLTGLVGPYLITFATKPLMAAGVGCLAISTWLDNVDGIVYRHRGTPAVRGAFLDRFNHALIYPLTYAAFGFAAYQLSEDWRYVAVGMGAGMFRDAYETLGLYERKFIDENAPAIRRIRAREFFQSGMYRQARFWWVAPFFVARNLTNMLAVHPLVYSAMILAILLDAVPELVTCFLVLYAVRFFSYAILSFGTTFRGK